jgi:hypothetical protein
MHFHTAELQLNRLIGVETLRLGVSVYVVTALADPSGRAFCGRALAGIVGSNPMGARMFFLYSVYVVR